METGKTYYVRTVTDHWVGRVVEVIGSVVTLEEASWVANSGRLHQFVANGRAEGMEIEPVGTVCCHWLAYIPWPHKLFNKAV